MHLAIYCRTSGNKDEEKTYSIENQKAEGISFANKHGWSYKVYVDNGVSGTLPLTERPEFYKVFQKICDNEVSALFVFDQSRLERNTVTFTLFSAECLKRGCKVYTKNGELEFDDAQSKFVYTIQSASNELYAKLTSEKVKLANKQKAKKGITHGLLPYGYQRGKDGKYEVNEEEAKWVRKMYEMSLEGMGTYQIANFLNEEGIPTRFNNYKGKIKRKNQDTGSFEEFDKKAVKWRGNVVLDILKNSIHKGERWWDGELACELPVQIVSNELWGKVNKNLAENKKKYSGRKAKHNYLLNGLMTCKHCGNKYVGKRNLKNNDNFYVCKGRREKRICKESHGINIPKLENFIIQYLFYSNELKNKLLNVPKENSREKELKKKIKTLEAELLKAEKQKDRFYKLMINPELDGDQDIIEGYNKSKKTLEALNYEQDQLNNKLADLQNDVQKDIAKSSIEAYTKDISFKDLKKLVQALIKNVVIESCTVWDDEIAAYHLLFRLHIYFHNRSLYSRFVTDRSATQWMWDIGNYTEKQKAKLDEFSGIEYDNYFEDEKGNLIPKREIATITLDENNLITF